jgi:hypothetical protein
VFRNIGAPTAHTNDTKRVPDKPVLLVALTPKVYVPAGGTLEAEITPEELIES